MEKEFIPYELAVKLKALGFNERCLKCYYKDTGTLLEGNGNVYDTPTPTFSQAFRWFDDNTECSGYIVPSLKEGHFDWLIRIDWEEEIECEEAYSSRKEAELACLLALIEIVETKAE
jgi:hypothetical protein